MAAHRAGPFISVVIPNYNGAGILGACLESLERQTITDFEVLVVDNASRDDSLEVVRRVAPEAIILAQEKNLGSAGGVNAGIRAARGEWIAVLNNDTEVAENWLEETAAAIRRHPDAAFLACRILDYDNHLFVLALSPGYCRRADGMAAPGDHPRKAVGLYAGHGRRCPAGPCITGIAQAPAAALA